MDFVCEQGVDIFQSSIAQGTSCDGNGALDAEIEAMIDCDVIYVKGAANDGSTGGTCTTQYPADHPWTFAVAGMDTDAPCTTASAYYTADCDFADGSSMGGGSYNGVAGKASIIDITAPCDHGAVITPDIAESGVADVRQRQQLLQPVRRRSHGRAARLVRHARVGRAVLRQPHAELHAAHGRPLRGRRRHGARHQLPRRALGRGARRAGAVGPEEPVEHPPRLVVHLVRRLVQPHAQRSRRRHVPEGRRLARRHATTRTSR